MGQWDLWNLCYQFPWRPFDRLVRLAQSARLAQLVLSVRFRPSLR